MSNWFLSRGRDPHSDAAKIRRPRVRWSLLCPSRGRDPHSDATKIRRPRKSVETVRAAEIASRPQVPPAGALDAAAAARFEPRGVTAADTAVFLIGCFPFGWATWERAPRADPNRRTRRVAGARGADVALPRSVPEDRGPAPLFLSIVGGFRSLGRAAPRRRRRETARRRFWRRIAVGASFGTGADSVVFDVDGGDADDDQVRRFGGRRVLGKGALAVAYLLFAIAGGSVLLAVVAALQV